MSFWWKECWGGVGGVLEGIWKWLEPAEVEVSQIHENPGVHSLPEWQELEEEISD